MRKISLGACFGIFIASSIILSGCSCLKNSKSHLSINMSDDPRSLDPREVRLLSNINLIKHMYEGLVEENAATGEITPALAKSYSVSDDGKVYTFYLKEISWSNGDPLVAADFIRSWEQVMTHEVTGVYGFAFDAIKNAKKVFNGEADIKDIGFYAQDEKTLVIELEKPNSYFLKLLSLPIFFPVHHSLRECKNALPVSTGAFYLKDMKPKQSLRLEKNPLYYNQDKVSTESITVYFIPDRNTASLMFNQGKLNWQGPPWGETIPLESMSSLRKNGNLMSYEVAGTSWITFNTRKFPFNHEKLRQSLALALDKEALVSTIFVDNRQPASHLLPQNIHTYPESATSFTSKEQKQLLAKKLFQEALEELSISESELEKHQFIFSAGSSISSLLVQLIREQWKHTLGFTIPIAGKEFATVQSELASGQFSISTGGWFADFSDPMAFLSIFAHPSGIPPYAIDHQEFLAILDAANHEKDPEKRSELISQAALYLESLHIIEPIYHDALNFAVNKKMSNLGISSTGLVDLRYVSAS